MMGPKRDAIRKAIRNQTAANAAVPEAVRAALVRMGPYTKEGKVTAEYEKDKRAATTRK